MRESAYMHVACSSERCPDCGLACGDCGVWVCGDHGVPDRAGLATAHARRVDDVVQPAAHLQVEKI